MPDAIAPKRFKSRRNNDLPRFTPIAAGDLNVGFR